MFIGLPSKPRVYGHTKWQKLCVIVTTFPSYCYSPSLTGEWGQGDRLLNNLGQRLQLSVEPDSRVTSAASRLWFSYQESYGGSQQHGRGAHHESAGVTSGSINDMTGQNRTDNTADSPEERSGAQYYSHMG